jgi:hypothetical protein
MRRRFVGICSAHRYLALGCIPCSAHFRHALIDFNEELAAAGAVGECTCKDCGYEWHRVIGRCPICLTAPRALAPPYVGIAPLPHG